MGHFHMRSSLLFIFLLVFGCSNQESDTEMNHDSGSHETTSHDPATHDESGMVLDSSAPGLGDYSLYQIETTWVTQFGSSMQLSALAGRPQVVAMTYTSCEVSCPRIVSAMQHIQRESATDAGFVLITIDPERDSPESMLAYASKMKLGENTWNLLSSTEDDIREMAALLGVRFQQMPDGEYAHSNIITVLDKGGVIVHQQNGIASDLTQETLSMLNSMQP